MSRLIGDVEFVATKTEPKHRPKYKRLRDALDAAKASDQRVLVSYLGPERLREQAASLLSDGTPVIDKYISLREFAEMKSSEMPEESRALWPYVQRILEGIERQAQASRSPLRR